jgi:hypothetical protein
MQGHPIFLTMYEGEAEFDMRIRTDWCMVEAFFRDGRSARDDEHGTTGRGGALQRSHPRCGGRFHLGIGPY